MFDPARNKIPVSRLTKKAEKKKRPAALKKFKGSELAHKTCAMVEWVMA